MSNLCTYLGIYKKMMTLMMDELSSELFQTFHVCCVIMDWFQQKTGDHECLVLEAEQR
jgi:hypothetical protein